MELLEDKMKINFSNWLILVSNKIKKNVVYDGNLIVVVENIDTFKSSDFINKINLKFWFPKIIPERIKIILTISNDNEAYKFLKSIGS